MPSRARESLLDTQYAITIFDDQLAPCSTEASSGDMTPVDSCKSGVFYKGGGRWWDRGIA